MTFSFGGVGVKIMLHKERFEIEHQKADGLLQEISEQTKLVATLQRHLSIYLKQVQKDMSGDLRKLSVSTNLGKMLVASKGLIGNINVEMDKLGKLQVECRSALDRAEAAFPDYEKFHMNSNGRLSGVPSGGRIFFQSEKGGAPTPFVTSSPQQPSVSMASLSDVALSRRFSK